MSSNNKFNIFEAEATRYGVFLENLNVIAKGHQDSILLLASQCRDFSIGILALKDTLTYSSRVTLLRGLFEASMRLNYVVMHKQCGADLLEFSDLKAWLSKFALAKGICDEIREENIAPMKDRLAKLETELKSCPEKRLKPLAFKDILEEIIEERSEADYWLYRKWSGIAHSELFELSRQSARETGAESRVTSLICTPDQMDEIYTDATLMLKRAGNCVFNALCEEREFHAP